VAITIAIINQKGGVGKSTSALSIGIGLSRKGYQVLFIDLDAQGNLSHTMGSDNVSLGAMEVLCKKVSAEQAIQRTIQGSIIASSPALAGADIAITEVGKEYRLKEALDALQADYDYIVIDTPPSLGILTVNALTACNGCIIPAQPDIYSLQGIIQLYGTLQTIRKYCNPSLRIMGILLIRYMGRTVITREVTKMMEQTAKQLKTKLYTTRIRECIAIKESQTARQNIFDYAPNSNAAMDYTMLVEEIIKEE
jgi:chromosome partitioning protein